MKVKEIVEIIKGKLVKGDLEAEVGSFSKDTRTINVGETYIGIKGENFDGNILWKEAFDKGATTVILQGIEFNEEELEKIQNKNIILVEDTIEALSDIAIHKRNLYGKDFPLIGVTGSVGKTSTKDIIANVISQKYNTLKTDGNKNNNIGLPFTMFNLSNHEAAVIEMGMNHFEEMSKLTKIAQPKIAVMTNIGTSHIGNLGSRENILKAKLEILEGMDKKVLVINNDNDLLHDLYLNNKDIEIHTYGIENQSEVMAEDIVLNDNNSEFICNLKGEKFKVKVPVGGIHFIYNSLCAITVANLLGIDTELIIKGIETFELTKKRMDITKLENGVTIINDSYNANPESMQAALKYLGALKEGRRIAVLGDMFELGEYSKELHERVGRESVKNNIDILICLGDRAKDIVKAAKEEGIDESKVYYFEDRDKLKDFIKDNWKSGDNILFKASNAMKFFELAESLLR